MDGSIYKLVKGKTYSITTQFIDYDGIIHKVGVVWTFDKTEFLPYHSELTLFVIENGENITYHFQSEPEEQEELLHIFMNYVKQINI